MPPKKRIGPVSLCLGIMMIIASVSLAVNNITESRRAETSAAILKAELEASVAELTPDEVFRTDVASDEMTVKTVDGHDTVGIIDLPKIGISLPVLSEWSYDNLKYSACRYSGTPQNGRFIVLAHNYIRHFAGLKRLRVGDEVRFTDNLGTVTQYRVDKTEILGGYELGRLTSDDAALTLFTCTYGGRSRVVVRCEKI